jgi:signal transduction histidine kinase
MTRRDGPDPDAVVGVHNGSAPPTRGERRLNQLLLAAGDAARERIERDIHDGAQQRFTALSVRLALAAERHQASGHDEVGAELLDFADQVQEAIDDLREVAHGVYPSRLSADGLGCALASAGRYAALPVTVKCRVGRYSPEVERAVYFSCLEALQNAAKHAGKSVVTVRVWETKATLHFCVSDTGAGFDVATAARGAGISNMRSRLRSVNGTLVIDSESEQGTRVHGTVPQPDRQT